MFGNPITDGNQVAVGTYGYVLSFDLTIQEPDDVTQVQVQNSTTGVLSSVYTGATSLAELFALPQSSNAANVAWVQQGNNVYVFLKSSAYAFTSTNRIAFWFYRNAQNITLTTQKRDFPQEAKELAKAIELRKVYEMKGLRVPFEISNKIASERAKLGL